MTFETMAIPPRPELVSAVYGWVYRGDQLVLVEHADRGWALPGGERRPGETFWQTLARVAWTDAGVLLSRSRLLGGFRTTPMTGEQAGKPTYAVCLLAEAGDVMPFSDEFDASDRMLIEPALVSRVVANWTPLMAEALAYAEAVRQPTPIDALIEDSVAVA